MRAIGKYIVIEPIKENDTVTQGGLILAEKQREDVRFQLAKVIKVGDSVVAVKENDIIYFDQFFFIKNTLR